MGYRQKAIIMDRDKIRRTLIRITHEIIEKNRDPGQLILFGINSGGYPMARRLQAILLDLEGHHIPALPLDISPFRDDGKETSPVPGEESLPEITGRTVILVDDVLYTGRSVRAALDALNRLGRPRSVQLAVLVDRGHRELPIRADYVGKNVPTSRRELVEVVMGAEPEEEDLVRILEEMP